MAPAKREIQIKKKNPQAHHSISKNEIEVLQKIARSAALLGVDVPIFVFLPPKPCTDLTAGCHRCVNPACQPQPNQEHRKISMKEELVKLDMVVEKVRARLLFLESVAKQNAENSSNQGGDVNSSTPAVVSDVAPADQC